jgi:hypothetical protein
MSSRRTRPETTENRHESGGALSETVDAWRDPVPVSLAPAVSCHGVREDHVEAAVVGMDDDAVPRGDDHRKHHSLLSHPLQKLVERAIGHSHRRVKEMWDPVLVLIGVALPLVGRVGMKLLAEFVAPRRGSRGTEDSAYDQGGLISDAGFSEQQVAPPKHLRQLGLLRGVSLAVRQRVEADPAVSESVLQLKGIRWNGTDDSGPCLVRVQPHLGHGRTSP